MRGDAQVPLQNKIFSDIITFSESREWFKKKKKVQNIGGEKCCFTIDRAAVITN